MDFRVGGSEIQRTQEPDGPVHTYQGGYQDIVQDQRIITTYEMYMDDVLSSVSIATVELEPAGNGTTLRFRNRRLPRRLRLVGIARAGVTRSPEHARRGTRA